jgi:hypothetical protein
MKKTKSSHRVSLEISTILFESHTEECRCSYCHGIYTKKHYGLNIPKHWWNWNAWYIIKIYPRLYIRWTNRWFLRVQSFWKKITFEK